MTTTIAAASEWILVGSPREAGVSLRVSDSGLGLIYFSPRGLAAALGRRTMDHWQVPGGVDLRFCTMMWIDERGEPVGDDALEGASLLSSTGVSIPLAQAASLLGFESPESFATRFSGATNPAAKRAAVAISIDPGADWVDQAGSPLGRRKHLQLCRDGVFASARKVGKQWLVRRAEIDAHILATGKPPKGADVNDIDRELAALGMREL